VSSERSGRRRERRRRAGRGGRQSIWARPEPAARSPRHTREGIARAAIRIADDEGFGALSMRRVAAELGAGTMTLYHYVRTKDELLALVDDAVMGELLIPAGELPDGWRAGMREIAHRTRDAFVRHPWIVEMPKNADGGPNGALHVEQSLAAMAGTGLGSDDCLELIALVDDYVFGYVERFNPIKERAEANLEQLAEEHADEVAARMTELDAENFPHLHALFAGTEPGEAITRLVRIALDPGRFDRGLELLLDGIERRVDEAQRSAPSPKRGRRRRR
jgi:AcrR family transcriptional regulator